jgi:hypothetical protein
LEPRAINGLVRSAKRAARRRATAWRNLRGGAVQRAELVAVGVAQVG